MSYSRKGLLERSEVAITNTLNNPLIQQKLKAIGYTIEQVHAGDALRTQALEWKQVRKQKYSSKLSSTDALYQQWQALKIIYSEHVTLARLAFRQNRVMLKDLRLTGQRATSLPEWIEQTSAFYGAIAGIHKPMAKYGVKKEDLEQTKATLDTLITLRHQRISQQGTAQDATQKYQQATDALNAWMRDFREAARYALRHDEQLLESLGMLVASK